MKTHSPGTSSSCSTTITRQVMPVGEGVVRLCLVIQVRHSASVHDMQQVEGEEEEGEPVVGCV